MPPSEANPADSARCRPLEEPPKIGEERLDSLARLVAIVDRLRAPDGCPWDREQTVASMAPSLVEEAFECLEAIETDEANGAGGEGAVVEEAGDLLMVIVLICRIAEDEGRFDLARVADAVGEKLVRRHPHVFGDARVQGADGAVESWEAIKERERRGARKDSSALAGVPAALPALQRAHRLGEKALAAGFRWSDAGGALAKLREEVGELAELVEGEDPAPERLEHELGDVLLAAALLGNYTKIDPERALRTAVRRFEARFRAMEERLDGSVRGADLQRLIELWQAVKDAE